MVAETLEHDHEELADLLKALKSGLHKHAAGHSFELLDLLWARLAVHIRAENLCLFPAILDAPREAFSNREGVPSVEEATAIIESLRADHNFFMDQLARAVKTYREILANDEDPQFRAAQLELIRQRVDAVSLRLESHNALEEDQVYKWPMLILDASGLEELNGALKRQLENLPDRFVQ